ncbi:hypothetical protein AAC387_Pa02g1368 [Persea americana]
MVVVSSCRKVLSYARQQVQGCLVAAIESGTQNKPPVISRRKVKMKSSNHAPNALGDTCYNGQHKEPRFRSPKTHPKFGLQAATHLHEARIIAGQPYG